MFILEKVWRAFCRRAKEKLFLITNSKKIKGSFFYRNFEGSFKIGENFTVNSSLSANPTSYGNRTAIVVEGSLQIGDNVGISNASIYCANDISIGDDVLVGSNTKIFDTDFHDKLYSRRIATADKHVSKGFVKIGPGVFIGANCIIGKNVTIHEGAVVGAGSVLVNKSVPAGTIWAGNPAKQVSSV